MSSIIRFRIHINFNNLRPIINNQTSMITPNYLLQAYLNPATPPPTSPLLQILAFQLNPHTNDSDPIIIRLSDRTTFLDCCLGNNYQLKNCTIVENDQIKGPKQFNKYDIIRLSDFEIKPQGDKICKLKFFIKTIEFVQKAEWCLGRPAELIQHLDNINDMSNEDQNTHKINTYLQTTTSSTKIEHHSKPSAHIKIEDDREQPKENPKKVSEEIENKNKFEGQEILTGKEIIEGKEGIFIGRLIRIKMTSKQTKEGQLTVLILGMLDRSGDLVRINMAGRTAIKQFKELKKKKCYYIKGLETYQTQKMTLPQIKIKQKQFKIAEVHSPALVDSFELSYYHWDHQVKFADSERVDVIGVVEDIDDQTHYQDEASNKFVIRVTVRNIFKAVKISFWSDQIQHFKDARLKKKTPIILQDIRKKKNKFLDFTYQSSIIQLSSEPSLLSSLAYLLPQPEKLSPPKIISQIMAYISSEDQKVTKTITLVAHLIQIETTKMIYKLCSSCKRKVETDLCQSCRGGKFQYKYNCQLQFADFSGSVMSVAFDGPGGCLFGKTAEEMSKLTTSQLGLVLEQVLYGEYTISIESKNLRFIVRSIERIKKDEKYWEQSQQHIKEIKRYMHRI